MADFRFTVDGAKLRWMIFNTGLPLSVFAKQAGVSMETLRQWTRGGDARIESLAKVAKMLCVEPSELVKKQEDD